MCGILGVWDFSSRVDRALIKQMRDLLTHRGPDDKGIFIDNQIGLSHRRLSIIDLSKAGNQPMSNEDGSIWITYNGEIYNFQEIKEDLEKKGHQFKSNTDTEVIIHAYEEYGHNCLSLFNGMFALGIWDSNKRELFLARDRIGVKPLVYYQDKDKFIFASELKAILPYPEINKEVSEEAISHYLSFGYVPTPLCIFKSMAKLPPGHYAIVDKNNEISIKKYWEINFNTPINKTEEEYCREIIENLEKATKLRMISDVPLGAFLSGGIDSSAVVAMMSKLSKEPVKTFTIGFEEQDFDESKYARQISELFNTEHKEKIVKMDAVKIFDDLVWHYNEPFADSSAIPTYYVSQMTREHVIVALSGDAGDENFIGYNRYIPNRNEILAKLTPEVLKPIISRTGKCFFNQGHEKPLFQKIGRKFDLLNMKDEERCFEWQSHFNTYYKNELVKENLKKYDSKQILLGKTDRYEQTILKKQYFDFKHYLPDDILVKVDIASMAHSLEVRSPFLDYKLVENAASIPHQIKMKNNVKKYILKKALKGILPKDSLDRKKTGFAIPLVHWFRKDLKSLSYDILLDNITINRGYFNREAIKKLLDSHNQGADHSDRIWNLLFLEKWFRRFVD